MGYIPSQRVFIDKIRDKWMEGLRSIAIAREVVAIEFGFPDFITLRAKAFEDGVWKIEHYENR